MLVYRIGDPFPHQGLKPAAFDAPQALIITGGFFSVILRSTRPQEDKVLTSAAMHVGLYQKDAIPFVLFNWPGKMGFEVILNIHTATSEQAETWLNGKGNPITLFVLDAKTNIIMAMRPFSIPPILAGQIRDCLEKQDERYESAIAVDVRMEEIMAQITLQTMFERGTMYRIG